MLHRRLSLARSDDRARRPRSKSILVHRIAAAVDSSPVTPARRIVPGSFFYITSRCVNRSFRLVPRDEVRKAIHYCLAYVSEKYRSSRRLELYEFVFMSNHYHILGRDLAGVLPDFVCELNSLISRQLNALRGIGGRNFESGYGMQIVEGGERLLEHAIYTQVNPVAAFLVTCASKWRGVSSAKMEYGEAVAVRRPTRGLWSGKALHAGRSASRRSGRAAYADRCTMPATAKLVIDRPPIRLQQSDEELRAELRIKVAERESFFESERRRRRRRVLGMRAVKQRSFLELPAKREEMFGRRPSYSGESRPLRGTLAAARRAFLEAYAIAREAFRAGQRDVAFPEGTWLMVRRHRVRCQPLAIP